MPSPKLERVRAQYQGVSGLLVRMAEYVSRQTAEGDPVLPKLAAAALGIPKGDAFVLLRMLTEGGILQQQYDVYCRDKQVFIQSVNTLDELDEVNPCHFCDKEHEPSELSAEIAFRLADGLGATDLAA